MDSSIPSIIMACSTTATLVTITKAIRIVWLFQGMEEVSQVR
jgi:hypothetical protein